MTSLSLLAGRAVAIIFLFRTLMYFNHVKANSEESDKFAQWYRIVADAASLKSVFTHFTISYFII